MVTPVTHPDFRLQLDPASVRLDTRGDQRRSLRGPSARHRPQGGRDPNHFSARVRWGVPAHLVVPCYRAPGLAEPPRLSACEICALTAPFTKYKALYASHDSPSLMICQILI
ncbi:hypothetical protein NDU88_007556 [Pleurodeles waltl]|uniref:Uncharacterized protein n=1 Tax=Pleurodeles waltl TaxID=8319 RepID=A0AAV7M077_PLEWA|nr:hypothetical protein NDU88_007556 [Pleurodeles waltl]